MSKLEAALEQAMRFDPDIPPAVREYHFALPRRWRFDFAWPDLMFAVEVEGGIFTRGRHVRAMGFKKDVEKYNEADRLGWRYHRVTSFDFDRRGRGKAAYYEVHGDALAEIRDKLQDMQKAGR